MWRVVGTTSRREVVDWARNPFINHGRIALTIPTYLYSSDYLTSQMCLVYFLSLVWTTRQLYHDRETHTVGFCGSSTRLVSNINGLKFIQLQIQGSRGVHVPLPLWAQIKGRSVVCSHSTIKMEPVFIAIIYYLKLYITDVDLCIFIY